MWKIDLKVTIYYDHHETALKILKVRDSNFRECILRTDPILEPILQLKAAIEVIICVLARESC